MYKVFYITRLTDAYICTYVYKRQSTCTSATNQSSADRAIIAAPTLHILTHIYVYNILYSYIICENICTYTTSLLVFFASCNLYLKAFMERSLELFVIVIVVG